MLCGLECNGLDRGSGRWIERIALPTVGSRASIHDHRHASLDYLVGRV